MNTQVDLVHTIKMFDVEQTQLEKNLLVMMAETKVSEATPEIVFGALVGVGGSLTDKRIRCQGLKPQNIMEVIKSWQADDDARLPQITQLLNAPINQNLQSFYNEAFKWLKDNQLLTIPEDALVRLLSQYLDKSVLEALLQHGMLDWQKFIDGFKQASEPITVWNTDSEALRIDTAFDKSGKRTLNNLKAETVGLGFQQYTVEALFIAQLSDNRSALNIALLTDPKQKVNSIDLAARLRNQMKRPVLISGLGDINLNNCSARLIGVIDQGAEIARMSGKDFITSRDLAEALLFKERSSGLGKVLEHIGVDLNSLLEFVECLEQEAEESIAAFESTQQLENHVKQRIIGQDHAIQRIMPLIKRLKFGYHRPGKPAGVFLFMGPTGTGKTLMAKVLAKTIYGSSENLLMLEMGQFGTRESKSMFIGAPPGYVGYGDGKLTNGIRDNPECVILFDEVEKANPLVLDVLLRFLDEGQIDDPAGPVRDGSKCLIVLTSNFLADQLDKFEDQLKNPDPQSHDAVYQQLRRELLEIGQSSGDDKVKKFFRPEFVFRIDETILFRSFSKEDYCKIADMEIKRECGYIKDRYNISLQCEDSIVELIAELAEERRSEGARVINRLVNIYMVNPFIDFLTGSRTKKPRKLTLKWDAGERQIMVGTNP
jgi:ATP-dependent Clp protease ATP-binding subunit ClpA